MGVLLAAATCSGVGAPAGAAPAVRHPPRLLVGAYYYLWWPQNLSEGTLRGHLVPSQAPAPSFDASANPATAERAIDQAVRAGIDFFALDWWPDSARNWNDHGAAVDTMADRFVKANNIRRIKYCMFYETWGLGFNAANQTTSVTLATELRFDADMLDLARRYFDDPSYLRIDGRPVVFLYLTRTLTGDVGGMIEGARTYLAQYGYSAFFVGDEIYWDVTAEFPTSAQDTVVDSPQVGRISAFDAITGYSLYEGAPSPGGPTADFVGYPGRTNLVADELALYRAYAAASGGLVPVIPDVTPGFNDRGTRLAVDHPAEPRQWLAGEGPASTLDHVFREVAVPSLSPTLPMVMVTAWNEWNEDSGVQPIGGRPTARDDSSTGACYTQGYTYGGEGGSDLAVLGRDIAAARRQVAESGGA